MKRLYYQHKMYVWVSATLFLVLSTLMYAWQVSQLRNDQNQKKALVQLLENAPEILAKQKDSLKRFENLVSKQQNGSLNIVSHNEFIRIIEDACNQTNVRILSIPQESLENNQTYQLAKVEMKLEGTYKNLIRLLFMIENEKKIGKIQFLDMKIEEFSKNLEIKNYLTLELTLYRLIGEGK